MIYVFKIRFLIYINQIRVSLHILKNLRFLKIIINIFIFKKNIYDEKEVLL